MRSKKLFLPAIFFLSSFLIAMIRSDAQTLAFSQVKLVTTTETVPAGKVWKIESVIYNIPATASSYQTTNGGCGISNYDATAITINGIPTKVGQGTVPASYSNLAYTHSYTNLPVWLPEGTTLSGGPCNIQISVIEFTVVP